MAKRINELVNDMRERNNPLMDAAREATAPRYGKGNIDLTDRPILYNSDGSYSTVDSFSTNIDGREMLLPTIGRGQYGEPVRWTEDEAVQHYMDTGEHLGSFRTPAEADRYAQWLHNSQADYYADAAQRGMGRIMPGSRDYLDMIDTASRDAEDRHQASLAQSKAKWDAFAARTPTDTPTPAVLTPDTVYFGPYADEVSELRRLRRKESMIEISGPEIWRIAELEHILGEAGITVV